MSHPGAEEILGYAAGRLVDGERRSELEEHVAFCGPCGGAFDEALGIVAVIAEDEEETGGGEPPVPWSERTTATMQRVATARAQAGILFGSPGPPWPSSVEGPRERLATHRDRGDALFIEEVAQRAVWFADEDPQAILGLADDLRATGNLTEVASALLGLAEGAARTARGEHHLALEAFQRGEDAIGERALSHEYARICLARAQPLRLLGQDDEALRSLEIARRVFRRHSDVRGEAKTLWEAANVAWMRGESRLGFRLAHAARRRLLAAGDAAGARMVLHVVASCLISLGRGRRAQQILDVLDATAGASPAEHARLLSKRGKVAALAGEWRSATDRLSAAAELFAQVPDVQGAGWCLLTAAHVAGVHGQSALQAELAAGALQVLSRLPGLGAPAALAMAELRSALERRELLSAVVERLLHLPGSPRI